MKVYFDFDVPERRKKITGMALKNCGVEVAQENARLGRKCKIPQIVQNGRKAIQTLREQSFQTDGARLFNCLPKKLREIEKDQDLFKFELDKFLSSIPDQLRVGSLVPEATCTVCDEYSYSYLYSQISV